MGASSSASTAAVVDAYSEDELVDILLQIGGDCRGRLARALQANPATAPATEEAAPLPSEATAEVNTAEATPAPASAPEKVAPLPSEAVVEASAAEDLPQKAEAALAPAPEDEVPPPSEAVAEAEATEEAPQKAEAPAEEAAAPALSSEETAFLREQLEALADPVSGQVRLSVLQRLFEKLGAGLGDQDLKVLVDAAGAPGKSPTPSQFLDFVLQAA